MTNSKIRNYAKEKNVYLWEMAKELNISEPTITRRFRFEMNEQDTQKMLSVINKISKEKKRTKQRGED